MSSRVVASMLAASVMFGTNGSLKDLFGADPHKVRHASFAAVLDSERATSAHNIYSFHQVRLIFRAHTLHPCDEVGLLQTTRKYIHCKMFCT